MKTTTMLAIATGKIPELTKIFTTLLSRQVLVRLEVKGKSPAPATFSPPPVVPTVIVPAAPPPPPPIAIVPEPPAPLPIAVVEPPPPTLAIVPPPAPPLPAPTLAIVPPPVQIQPPEPVEEVEIEAPMDFDEPPDSFDADRSVHLSLEQSQGIAPEPEIDPELQAATNNVVNIFNGEIIDRHHNLYNKIIDE